MKDKLIYAGLAIVLVFVVIVVIMSLNPSAKTNSENQNQELEKYRSEEIPEECRLPVYEEDLEWWKQHLGHHKETQHCLDYFV